MANSTTTPPPSISVPRRSIYGQSDWFIGRYRQQNANFCNEWKHMIDAIREPLQLRRAAGKAAAKGHTYKQALELDFNPPPLELSDRDSP